MSLMFIPATGWKIAGSGEYAKVGRVLPGLKEVGTRGLRYG